MAYYDDSYVDRIKQIKELQLKYFLPLKVIREIVAQPNAELSPRELVILRDTVNNLARLQEIRRTYNPHTLEELSRRSGLSKKEINEMEKCDMISAVKDKNGRKVYLDADIKVVEAFAGIRSGGMSSSMGFKVDQFRMQSDVISTLAKEEVKDFVRKVGLEFKDNYDIEYLAYLGENAIERVNVFMAALRRKKILEFIETLLSSRESAIDSIMAEGKREGTEVLMRHKIMEVIGNEKRGRRKKSGGNPGNTGHPR
jgi:DNA-binding transcriptional MerR regulator